MERVHPLFRARPSSVMTYTDVTLYGQDIRIWADHPRVITGDGGRGLEVTGEGAA